MANYKFSEAEKSILNAHGALAGLEKLGIQNPQSRQGLDEWRAALIGIWGTDAIEESEKEVEKISAALRRLKSTVQTIKAGRTIAANDPRVTQLKNDLDALDGWTISLLESVLSLMTFFDSKKGKEKVAKLSSSMQLMLAKGGKDGNPFDNKHHFAGYMG